MSTGFLVVDKPAGITSHDAVAVLRAVTGEKKVGHTGTLDPFATGVLPLALGGATKLIQFLDESVKVYDATIALGAATDTGDPTGQVVREAAVPVLQPDAVRDVLRTFVGERMQTPPQYSAVKHKGRPLYFYARKGVEVKVEARPIKISDVELVSLEADRLRVVLTCSRGTYARVLADEIAVALGTAGHLMALTRRRSGPFFLDRAVSFPELAELVAEEPGHSWEEVLLSRSRTGTRVKWRHRDEVCRGLEKRMLRPLEALSHLPLQDVDPDTAVQIRRGNAPPNPPAAVAAGGQYLVVVGDRVVALAERSHAGPKIVRLL